MRVLSFALCLFFAASLALAQDTLRIVSYNVGYGRDGTAEEIGEMLKEYHPDIVGFCEAPHGDWTARVGHVLGFHNVFLGDISSANMENKFKTILSRFPITDRHEIGLDAEGGWNPASAAGVCFEFHGKKVTFYSTHICFNEAENDHAKQLADIIKKRDDSDVIIVVGDFNCHSDHTSGIKHFFDDGYRDAWMELGLDTTKLYTYNALDPSDNLGVLDHIVYRGDVKAVDGGIIELERPLADHKPVWCELKFE